MATSAVSSQGSDRRFIRTAMKAPLLEADHELNLARAWHEHQDEDALHELTSAYMRLVIAMAAKFRVYGLPMGDLVQEGNVGLMQAAQRFDPERGVRFSTYASWWIRSSIQDYILRNWSIVRTGTTAAQKSLFFNLRRLRALINDGGRASMTPEGRDFIADKLRVPLRDVEAMESRLSASDRSLNATVPGAEGGEGASMEWQDMLADDRPDPEDQTREAHDAEVRRRWLARALETLNERELFIIKRRRLSEDGQTLEALGEQLGISKERVRQVEHQALNKLRAALLKETDDMESMLEDD
ncbi:RNA polymerase factor sigma-32 [Pyruvatibacter mobilis]|uniref:RNA polymerase factor sigma-32 n=1 Tax=Pyruvatibacter mobilis TaxID=1712261 RepID=A0A845Q7G7_9HYPH|nr:RNA polymerase factor sigma-32 [Pyruvatibacter mobilis]NBG94563.1 RNA polymerase factor sigma-32 [Pyruvatibacter mobilis]QJD74080.1 RNA polymerase factor sigma-32 [Pyruvatibacter mobilis]GGD03968.1 RNA polymerase sigma factor [Pyruvatibacter mobilis]